MNYRVLRAAVLSGFLTLSASQALAQQKQPIVAIARIDDLANSGQSPALTAMILSAIAGSGKFRVMERTQLGKLEAEQTLAKSGTVTSRNGGRTGKFEGVDYLIYGSITTLSVVKKADLASTFFMGLGTSNAAQRSTCYKGQVTMGIDIKITEAETGQIRYVKRLDEIQNSGSICGEGIPQTDVAALIRSAADRVAIGLVTTVYPIKVADVQPDGTITLNYGEGSVKIGDFLAVFQPGQTIIDPDTGMAMGSSEQRLGLIQITDVQTRMSKAKVIAGFATPAQVREIARPATAEDLSAFKPQKGKRSAG